MAKYLYISIFLLIFAKGIVGGNCPMTRENFAPPFPFHLGQSLERAKDMTKRKTVEEVKRDFYLKWKDLYDYSLINEYKDNKTPLPIKCRKHGVFMMSANSHLRGCGCRKCADERTGERCRMTIEEFLERALKIHGDCYDYSLVNKDNFVNAHTKIPIICPKHKTFEQTPDQHLSGRGCYKCGKERTAIKQALTREEVIARANKIFDNRYDYSLFTEYHSKDDRIKVICPKHGAWEVTVNNHLYNKSGCPKCKRSFGEERVVAFLEKNNIEYIEQYRIKNESLLCQNTLMMVDFYLPKQKAIIEYNGMQHYKDIPLFNTRSLDEQKERDYAVRLYCKIHKVKLIEIPYTEYDNIEGLLSREIKVMTNG